MSIKNITKNLRKIAGVAGIAALAYSSRANAATAPVTFTDTTSGETVIVVPSGKGSATLNVASQSATKPTFEVEYAKNFGYEQNPDVSEKNFQDAGISIRDRNKDGKLASASTFIDTFMGDADFTKYRFIAQVVDPTGKSTAEKYVIGFKEGQPFVIENEQFTSSFVLDPSKYWIIKGEPQWKYVAPNEFVFDQNAIKNSGLEEVMKGKVPMSQYFAAVLQTPMKGRIKAVVKKYAAKPNITNPNQVVVTGANDEFDIDDLTLSDIVGKLSGAQGSVRVSSGSTDSTFTSGRIAAGYSGNKTSLTIPKYDRNQRKIGEKTLESSAKDLELNADGRILLPHGFYSDANGKAVYVFNSKELGLDGNVNAGYRLGNFAAGVGIEALAERMSKDGALLLGPSGEVIYTPGMGLDFTASGSSLKGTVNANGLSDSNASMKKASVRARKYFENSAAEVLGGYTANTQFGNTTEHADLDARATYFVTKNGGVYVSAGLGKLLNGNTVSEADKRLGLGYERKF